MKLKALLLALFTAGFAVSIAVAASPAGLERGKPETTTATTSTDGSATTSEGKKGKDRAKEGKGHAKRSDACRPKRKLMLRGEFVAAGAGGFAMTVSGGNHGAKAWKGKQATVLVDDKTRFKGKKRSLAALAAGDRLAVQGYACKADAAAGSIVARLVMTKGPKRDHDDNKTTTTATTTAATTTAVTTTTP